MSTVFNCINATLEDRSGPYVLGFTPKSGGINVKVESSIIINFNENIRFGKNYKNISISFEGKRIPFSMKINKRQLILRPNSKLLYGTKHSINIPQGSLTDYYGNVNKSYSFSFKTEDLKFGNNTEKKADEVLTSYFSFLFYDNKNIYRKYRYQIDGEYLFFADIKDIGKIDGVKFSEAALPMAYYNGEYKYNPLLVAEWGLQNYSFYKRSGNGEYLNRAVIAANSLVDNLNSNGLWINEFDYKRENIYMKKGWSSSLTQGLGISLLVRVYNETKEEKYLSAAKLAFEPLKKGCNENGLKEEIYGLPFYDMFNVRSKFTFSSFMFVLFSFYDLLAYDEDARSLFYYSVETLRFLFDKYYKHDDNFYMTIQDCQLSALCSILDVDDIDEYFEDFKIENVE